MGRGRAKAKQTKVARELKYSSPDTDYEALQRELANGGGFPLTSTLPSADDSDDDAEDDDDWSPSR
ncbi:DUF3073 family protein [Motilibacter rhizosphaerae]|uniref:DUF3073 family protein n=1 Tax=Motilibacter rhizosphaerae TaxID=598652 RepID=A0A4Q7NX89_9ACTN|nr:DUF3073 domain-containing protein [Motilibacter rhizosphaerae]RZS91528.1 DUF3073 family protein [Motilibacter rhizosphaerae]